ncbi:MAG: MipA/OmpV family protein [Brevundimonas sp.]|uniref:MipA/OmpV family protein n=1 Tax=Brevundimonas sp. TaxID=1871086 RepID=UPI00391A1645
MRLRALAVAALMTAAASPALAQTQPFERVTPAPQGWTVDVGVGALYRKDSSGDTGSKTTVLPGAMINYRDLVYLNPIEGLGWNVVNQDDLRAGVQLRPRFGADDMEGLNIERPGFGGDLAAYAYKRLPGNIVIGGRISRDISGETDGTEYQASIGHQRVTPVGLLSGTVYVRGGDDKLANAYYGVNAVEAAANGISAYSPDGGLEGAGVNLILLAPIAPRWAVGGLVGYERRLGDIADSPLSQNDDTVRAGVFVARRFGG